MVDYQKIIDKYYGTDSRLRSLLMEHSRLVADKALKIVDKYNLNADRRFIEEAAMLHDIGIFRCNAPDIFCHGQLPYICHGIEGRKILDDMGLHRHALVCERHTGAGITVDDIKRQSLPLPARDMTPQSIEEKIVCYADKFYSKSGNVSKEKSRDRVLASIARHGDESLQRFLHLEKELGINAHEGQIEAC